jgi:hypothetical protein
MTAEFMWMNIPLMVLAFSLWVGVPMWMVLRHPDRHPAETRTLPHYLRQRQLTPAPAAVPAEIAAQGQVPAYEERQLASAIRI